MVSSSWAEYAGMHLLNIPSNGWYFVAIRHGSSNRKEREISEQLKISYCNEVQFSVPNDTLEKYETKQDKTTFIWTVYYKIEKIEIHTVASHLK